ncbi:MAG: hypothetical protein LCH88_03380 [Proteobacteria bacterium]|nr:hypothetical protein [Pseudomonadota bacterium]
MSGNARRQAAFPSRSEAGESHGKAGGETEARAAHRGVIGHGPEQLPSVIVTSCNLELRDKDGFIGDQASKSAFTDTLEEWRKRLAKLDADPLRDVMTIGTGLGNASFRNRSTT